MTRAKEREERFPFFFFFECFFFLSFLLFFVSTKKLFKDTEKKTRLVFLIDKKKGWAGLAVSLSFYYVQLFWLIKLQHRRQQHRQQQQRQQPSPRPRRPAAAACAPCGRAKGASRAPLPPFCCRLRRPTEAAAAGPRRRPEREAPGRPSSEG